MPQTKADRLAYQKEYRKRNPGYLRAWREKHPTYSRDWNRVARAGTMGCGAPGSKKILGVRVKSDLLAKVLGG